MSGMDAKRVFCQCSSRAWGHKEGGRVLPKQGSALKRLCSIGRALESRWSIPNAPCAMLLSQKLLRRISIAGGTITTTTATHEVRGNGSMPSVGSLPSCQQSSVIEFGDGAKSARYMSGGAKDAPASESPNTGATSEPDASPSDLLGGLGGLLNNFSRMVWATRSIPG